VKKLLSICLIVSLILALVIPSVAYGAKPGNTKDDYKIFKKQPAGQFGQALGSVMSNIRIQWQKPTAPAGFIGAPVKGERYAVVIGISDYPGELDVREDGLDLYYADDDALTIQNTLIDVYGFNPDNITLLTDRDATKSGILGALAGLKKKVTRNDEVVFYYSGHSAVYDTIVRNPFRLGDNAGLVVWADDLNEFAPDIVWDRQINTALNALKTNRIVIGLDCCFASTFSELSGIGRIFMGATDQDGISFEIGEAYADMFLPGTIPLELLSLNQGLFTYSFAVMGMQDGIADLPPYEGLVTVEEAFYFTQAYLTDLTQLAQSLGIPMDEIPVIIDLFRGDMGL